MGWTSYYVGKGFTAADRKRECDNIINGETTHRKWTVLKSAMKGKTYYAAVNIDDKETGESRVAACVILTSVDKGEFYYKDLDETCGPCEDDCPKAILDMLSPTTNSFALEWRERCRTRAQRLRQRSNSLAALPIGAVIEFDWGSEKCRVVKMAPAYQFKTPWYKDATEAYYWKKSQIPSDWKRVA